MTTEIVLQFLGSAGTIAVVLFFGGRWTGRIVEKIETQIKALDSHIEDDDSRFRGVHDEMTDLQRRTARIEGRQNGGIYGQRSS